MRAAIVVIVAAWFAYFACTAVVGADHLCELQTKAIEEGRSKAAHWGYDPANYLQWGSHSNRLIPVYTFGTKGAGKGIDLRDYTGVNSPYRDPKSIQRLYGRTPENTLAPEAEYLDQTNVYDIQYAALRAGKKHIFLVVFDGMDWQTTQAASIYNLQRVAYDKGRGVGTHLQEYQAAGTTQFGFMVTSPHNDGTAVDVDKQIVLNPGGALGGGYDPVRGGPNPWTIGADGQYLISAKSSPQRHATTDSASAAVSMTAGIKTYNDAICVDHTGRKVKMIAHHAQQQGYAVGAVSSVPISHATPACAYAHNVDRDDYQDLTRDMLGLPSISHPDEPLAGMDVVIGGGHGAVRDKDNGQGVNFVPGNAVLTAHDMQQVNVDNGGRYVVAERMAGKNGAELLAQAAQRAADGNHRLLGFFGVGAYAGHLPFQTADGAYDPAPGRKKQAESYSPADVTENPTLAELTSAALRVLQTNDRGFWLMVEAGDVDWANHDNNLDNSIGAVNSGDSAVKIITDWVEKNSDWNESVMVVTADHGHYLFLDQPEMLISQDQ